MNCPHCGFDRILPMYKVCPKCKQPLNVSAESKTAEKDSVQAPFAPETKLITGLFWSYQKAIKDPNAFMEYAKKNPNDSTKLLNKWEKEGRDISILSTSSTTAATNNLPESKPSTQSSADENIGSSLSNATTKNDVGTIVTKNKSNNYITWQIAQNQFARNISAQEVANMSDADGVYVQEGVTAVIFVDGEIVSELEGGGLYKFASAKVYNEAAAQYAEDEEDKRVHEGIIKKIGRVGRSLLNLVFGKSDKTRQENNKKRRDSIKEIAKKITGNSVVSVVLKRDGVVRTTMGIRPVTAEDGSMKMEFAPYKIHTQSLTVDVAIDFEARITNFREFRTTYLMDQNSYSANDLRTALNTFTRTALQRALQNYAADGELLPAELMASISYELMAKSQELLHGIAITNVLDITTSNEAFERFRMLEEKLFCTDKEIDYLSRTNEFKNRLQSVENQQKVAEAKTVLDLRKELDKINNDQLIHEDEMEAFVQLLQSQKRIREARTENEELAELLKLKGNRLVSEDELDALESSIRDKKFDRDQVSATFQLNAVHRTEMTRIQLDAERQKNQLLYEAELNDIRFEQVRKDLAREIELAELQEEHDLASAKRQDDYADSRREKDFEFDQRQKDAEYVRKQREAQDTLDLEKQRTQNEMDLLRQKAEIARQNMQAMQQHEQEMAEKKHQEEMARIAAQQNMTAEQLMAAGAAGLSAEAQKAFAESLAAGKGGDKEREMYERMLQMQADSNSSNQAQQAAMMQQMMAMMQGAMQTNATMATNMAAGQAAQQQAQLEAMQNIAGARVAQTEGMKDEYRKQMEHEQKRTDAAQDKALNYTTKITQEEIKAESKIAGKVSSKDEEAPYFIPDFGTNYTLKEMGNLILNGTIDPDTELEVKGESMTVAEVEEFYPFLEKKYGNA